MASTALRGPIGHDERLSLVEHLDELRSRLIISALAIVIAFGFCFWQNKTLLNIVNRPVVHQTQKEVRQGNGPLGQTYLAQEAVRQVARTDRAVYQALLRPDSGLSPAARSALGPRVRALNHALALLPKQPPGNKPITLGVGEPFANTMLISLYFALLFAMPIVLWQLYSFVLPAFSASERRVALPLLLMIPGLFICGVLFGYFLVMPAAVHFLLTFNSGQFNILVQANQYYRFEVFLLLAMGIVFQVPVGILALTKTGIVKLERLRKSRRYAIVACAVIATPLPGTDPLSMILETVMLYVLFEVGIVISAIFGRPREDAAEVEDVEPAS